MIETSVRSIDLGFDPRRHGMSVTLPRNVWAVAYDTDMDGRISHPARATGTLPEIESALSSAGYTVEWRD